MSATVLVVDDDEDARRIAVDTLSTHGYLCFEAASGPEARRLLDREAGINAVVCDIDVPVESGTELVADLSADFPDVTVVIMTALDSPDVARMAESIDASGYLIKPVAAEVLVVFLASALQQHDRDSLHRRQVHALEQAITRTRVLHRAIHRLEADPDVTPEGDEEMIDRLSQAVSLRDEETGRHIERMSRYAVVVADAAGFRGLPPEQLRLASALHDVGKIGVPDVVLLKPGPLSADERIAMQRHAQLGYQLLGESTSELLRVGARLALTHHEWWDGGGYPRGLSGTDIPQEARIAAIADVFDALTSHRVYRQGLSVDEASRWMRDLRGRQFEPRLLDAFLGSLDEICSIREAYPEEGDAQKRISVLVVDDHVIFAQSLVRLLGAQPEVKVVGVAGTVAEGVAGALAYQPNVILMDVDLPDGNGFQATEQIKTLIPAANVIILTGHTDDQALAAAIAAGCSGFVRKDDAVEELFAAIVAAHDGEIIAPRLDLAPLLRQLRPTRRGAGAELTAREHEVLGLIASGLVNKQVAAALQISLNTVRNHAQNILYKLHAHSKLEAVAIALREGLIDYPIQVTAS